MFDSVNFNALRGSNGAPLASVLLGSICGATLQALRMTLHACVQSVARNGASRAAAGLAGVRSAEWSAALAVPGRSWADVWTRVVRPPLQARLSVLHEMVPYPPSPPVAQALRPEGLNTRGLRLRPYCVLVPVAHRRRRLSHGGFRIAVGMGMSLSMSNRLETGIGDQRTASHSCLQQDGRVSNAVWHDAAWPCLPQRRLRPRCSTALSISMLSSDSADFNQSGPEYGGIAHGDSAVFIRSFGVAPRLCGGLGCCTAVLRRVG
jgi:hypothetical protein